MAAISKRLGCRAAAAVAADAVDMCSAAAAGSRGKWCDSGLNCDGRPRPGKCDRGVLGKGLRCAAAAEGAVLREGGEGRGRGEKSRGECRCAWLGPHKGGESLSIETKGETNPK